MKQSLEVKLKAVMSFCLIMVFVSYHFQPPDTNLSSDSEEDTFTAGQAYNKLDVDIHKIINADKSSIKSKGDRKSTLEDDSDSIAPPAHVLERLQVLSDGHITDIQTIHTTGLPHAACWVHILAPDGGILMSERSKESYICPNTLSSLGEHMKINETPDECALRCVREEGGFSDDWLPEDHGLVVETTRSFWFNHTFPAKYTRDSIPRKEQQLTYEYRLVADTRRTVSQSARQNAVDFFKAKSFTASSELDYFVFLTPDELETSPATRFCGKKLYNAMNRVLREYNQG